MPSVPRNLSNSTACLPGKDKKIAKDRMARNARCWEEAAHGAPARLASRRATLC